MQGIAKIAKMGMGGTGGLVFGFISPPALFVGALILFLTCVIVYACHKKWWECLYCVTALALALIGASIQFQYFQVQGFPIRGHNS